MKSLSLVSVMLLALVITGAGCAKKTETPAQDNSKQAAQEQKPVDQKPAENLPATETAGTWVHPQYEFSFTLPLGTSSKFKSMDSVDFVDPATQKVYANMAIQADIPGIPLPDSLIDEVMVDGVKGHIYHDTDAQTGKQKIDKLTVIMPGTNKTVYIAVPVENMDSFDLKDAVKTWKWKK